jgi:hypothetical protein
MLDDLSHEVLNSNGKSSLFLYIAPCLGVGTLLIAVEFEVGSPELGI